MSLEKAKGFIEKLKKDPEMKVSIKNSIDAALTENNYDCSTDELKEALIMSLELDESELASITGGDAAQLSPAGPWPDRYGGCTANYYKEQCASSVDARDWCGSSDFCFIWTNDYNPV